MKCLTDCVCNIHKGCLRDTVHLKSARCRGRTVPIDARKKEKSSRPKRDEESKSH
jgi:hypothetical protein